MASAQTFGSGPAWSQAEYTRCGGLSNGSFEGLITGSVWSVRPGVTWNAAQLFCFAGGHEHATQLVKARLSGANIHNSDLHNVNLYGADLSGASLATSNFQQVNLSEVNFQGATLGDELSADQKQFIRGAKNEARKDIQRLLRVYKTLPKAEGCAGGLSAGLGLEKLCRNLNGDDATSTLLEKLTVKLDEYGLGAGVQKWNASVDALTSLSDETKSLAASDTPPAEWKSYEAKRMKTLKSAEDQLNDEIKKQVKATDKALDLQSGCLLDAWCRSFAKARGVDPSGIANYEALVEAKATLVREKNLLTTDPVVQANIARYQAVADEQAALVDDLGRKLSAAEHWNPVYFSMSEAPEEVDTQKLLRIQSDIESNTRSLSYLEDVLKFTKDPASGSTAEAISVVEDQLARSKAAKAASEAEFKTTWVAERTKAVKSIAGEKALAVIARDQAKEQVSNFGGLGLAKYWAKAKQGVSQALNAGLKTSVSGIAGKLLEGPFSLIQIDKLIPADVMYPHLDFTGANFTGANFDGATMAGAEFTDADLTDTSMVGTTIQGGIFEGADLGTDGSRFTGIMARGIEGTPSRIPAGWHLIKGMLVGPGANLYGVDFSGMDLRGYDLSGAYLAGADLSDADLTGSNLIGTSLAGADLSRANISDTMLSGADLTGATLLGIRAQGLLGKPDGIQAPWSIYNGVLLGPTADVSGADLSGLNLSERVLNGTNFTGANLAGTNFQFASTVGALFDAINGTGIVGADTIGTGQVLNGRLITAHPDLRGANLEGVDLSNVDLTGSRSGGITGTPSALPANWSLVSGFLIGPGADLSGANLAGVDLRDVLPVPGVNDEGYRPSGGPGSLVKGRISMKSGGITGTPILPSGWKVANGYLIGPYADLTGADLTGTSLAGASLEWADFTNAILKNANLTDVDFGSRRNSPTGLEGLRSGGATATPGTFRLPDGWVLANGYLIGPGAHPTGDLKGGMDLTGADLSGVGLNGTWLGPIKYSQRPAALPAGYDYVNNGGGDGFAPQDLTYVAGPGAQLQGADIDCTDGKQANKTWTYVKRLIGLGDVSTMARPDFAPSLHNLTGINLSRANIRYCSFDGLDLSNADFSGSVGDYLKFNRYTNLYRASFANADFITSDSLTVEAYLRNSNLSGIKTEYNGAQRELIANVRQLQCQSSNGQTRMCAEAIALHDYCMHYDAERSLWVKTDDPVCNRDLFASDVFGSVFGARTEYRGAMAFGLPVNVVEDNTSSERERAVNALTSVLPLLLDIASGGGVPGLVGGAVQLIVQGFTEQGKTLKTAFPAPTGVLVSPVPTPSGFNPDDPNWTDRASRFNQGRWVDISFRKPPNINGQKLTYEVWFCPSGNVVQEDCVPAPGADWRGNGHVAYKPWKRSTNNVLRLQVPTGLSENGTAIGSTFTVRIKTVAEQDAGIWVDVVGHNGWSYVQVVGNLPAGIAPGWTVRTDRLGDLALPGAGTTVKGTRESDRTPDCRSGGCPIVQLHSPLRADTNGPFVFEPPSMTSEFSDPSAVTNAFRRTQPPVATAAPYFMDGQSGELIRITDSGSKVDRSRPTASSYDLEVYDLGVRELDPPLPTDDGTYRPSPLTAFPDTGAENPDLELSVKPGDSQCPTASSTTTCVKIPNLTAGHHYQVRVRQVTIEGESAWAPVTDISAERMATGDIGWRFEGDALTEDTISGYSHNCTIVAMQTMASDAIGWGPGEGEHCVNRWRVRGADQNAVGTYGDVWPITKPSAPAAARVRSSVTRYSPVNSKSDGSSLSRDSGWRAVYALPVGQEAVCAERLRDYRDEDGKVSFPLESLDQRIRCNNNGEPFTNVVLSVTPGSDGGGTITNYFVKAVNLDHPAKSFVWPYRTDFNRNDSWMWHKRELRIPIWGLVPGDRYRFEVAAGYDSTLRYDNSLVRVTDNNDESQIGPKLITDEWLAPGAPTRPSNVAVESQTDTSATVRFTPATERGSPITGYTVTAADLDSPDPTRVVTASGTTSPIAVAGLIKGRDYTFVVVANSALGESDESDPSPVTAFTGGAESNASAVAARPGLITRGAAGVLVGGKRALNLEGRGQLGDWEENPAAAILQWVAPSTDRSSVTGYTITAINLTDPARGGQTKTVSPFTPPTAPPSWVRVQDRLGTSGRTFDWKSYAAKPWFGIDGLEGGDSYAFTVTTHRADKADTVSAQSEAVTIPQTAPRQVKDVTANASDGVVTLSFPSPRARGGQITGYDVKVYDSTSQVDLPVRTIAGGAAPLRVSGLTNGRSYGIEVAARNSSGTGLYSTRVYGYPGRLPGPPTDVSATASYSSSAGRVTTSVTWTKPVDLGGRLFRDCKIVAIDLSDDGRRTEPRGCRTDGATEFNTVFGYPTPDLVLGHRYKFAVSVRTDLGWGPESTSNIVVGRAPPARPANVVATPSDGAASVAFTEPDDNGAPISSYTLTAYDFTGAVVSTVTGSGSPINVAGLTNGLSYRFAVGATNSVGAGPQSERTVLPVVPLGKPGVPRGLDASVRDPRGGFKADLEWTAPAARGAAITSYEVALNDLTDPSRTDQEVAVGQGQSAIASGLVSGHSYSFAVRAVNAAGAGGWSSQSAEFSMPTEPGAPSGVTAVLGSTQGTRSTATLVWRPATASVGAITAYEVVAQPGGKTCDTGGQTTCEINELTNGTTYTFAVRAKNAVGYGDWSEASSPVTPADGPDRPAGPAVTSQDSSVSVAFGAPHANGAEITGYTVEVRTGGNQVASVTGTSSPITVTGLSNGKAYNFGIRATNRIGTSETSQWVTAVPAVAPDRPTGLAVSAGASTAWITFDVPAAGADPRTCACGGAAIGAYVLVTNDLTSGATSSRTIELSEAQQARQVSVSPIVASGLTDGHRYSFSLRAVNAAGQSAASATSDEVTAGAAPVRPTGVSAVAGRGSAVVSFTDASTPSLPVTSYTVTAFDLTKPDRGGQTTTVLASSGVGSTRSAEVTGLTNGDRYVFEVVATNLVGDGTPSYRSTYVIPAGEPSAARTVRAVPGRGSATVRWSVPISDGGSPLTGYSVTSTPAVDPPAGCSGAGGLTTSCVFTGLSNGTAYTFTVKAINAVGSGDASSESPPVTPITTPGAPTGVSATQGDGAATVRWNAPESDGGSALTGYRVTATNTQSQLYPITPASCKPPQLTGAATTCVFTGLAGGAGYKFKVVAINAAGAGAVSAESLPLTAVARPSEPNLVDATPRDSSASVAFAAPSPNGSPITGYTVTAYDSSGASITTASGASSPILVDGLTNGGLYTFKVSATNEVGDSNPSTASPAVVPVGVPGAPGKPVVAPGNGSASVTFLAAASNGSTVSKYTVTALNSADEVVDTAEGGTGPARFSGLMNGASYRFKVTATNVAGTGPSSVESDPVTPAAPPGLPTSVVARAGDGQAQVRWSAPVADGGAAITGYSLAVLVESQGRWVPVRTTAEDRSPVTVDGLTNGRTYSFKVSAINSVGLGQTAGSEGTTVPAGVPGAAYNLVATAAGTTSANLAFSPAPANGSAITAYRVFAKDKTDSGDWVQKLSLGSAGALQDNLVSGLTEGHDYSFKVVATNAVGDGPDSLESSSVATATAPDRPGEPVGVRGDGNALVYFAEPAANGSAISSFTVQTLTDDGSTVVSSTSGTESPIAIAGLTNGTRYTFKVSATNAVGTSPFSLESDVGVVPAGLPGAVSKPTAARGNAEATVSFGPAAANGSAVTGYTVTAFDSAGNAAATKKTAGSGSVVVTRLINGEPYTFRVTAANALGSGAASAESDAIVPAGLSPAPVAAVATAGDGTATVSWKAPANDNGAAITGYTVTGGGASDLRCTTDKTSCDFTGLTNGGSYTFTIAANNAVGTSSNYATSNTVKPGGLPAAPGGVTATFLDVNPLVLEDGLLHTRVARVTWDGASDGGSPITGYTITSNDLTDPSATVVTAWVPSWLGLAGNVPDLDPSHSYNFTVTASNRIGAGPASEPSGSLELARVPDYPTQVRADAGESSADVYFTEPAANGSAITGYTVAVSTASGAAVKTVSGAASPVNVTGLTNGQSYLFKVSATNALGTGAYSRQTGLVTLVGAPGVPTGVAADLVDGAAYVVGGSALTPKVARVQFSAPADSGGSSITGYVLYAQNETNQARSRVVALSSVSRGATIADLQRGDRYTFTVAARNAVGVGEPSQATDPVVPAAPPATPASVTATRGSGSASISFATPADNGAEITGYTVRIRDLDTSDDRFVTVGAPGPLEVGGLVNGNRYRFKVAATNSAGAGAESDWTEALTPADVPGTPSVTATAIDGGASLEIVAPADNGAAINGYTVGVYGEDGSLVSSGPLGLHATTVGGLTNGRSYTFKVAAVNSAGSGQESAASNSIRPVGKPFTPTGVAVADGDRSATVSFVESSPNGLPVDSYEVRVEGLDWPYIRRTFTGSNSPINVTSLVNGSRYTFAVRAVDSSGQASGYAEAGAESVPADVPIAPYFVTAVGGDSSASVRWSSATANGSPVTRYKVTATPNGKTCVTSALTAGPSSGCTVQGLRNGTAYTFSVTATSARGDSLASDASNQVVPAGLPMLRQR